MLTFLSAVFQFAKIPVFQHPRSLIPCFPEDVYLNSGSSTVIPQLLERLDADKVLAVQFLRSGRVRLTFNDSGTCDDALEKGLEFDGAPLRLLPADRRLRTVFLRDLPIEISDAVGSFPVRLWGSPAC